MSATTRHQRTRWQRTLVASLMVTGGLLAAAPRPASAYCTASMTTWDHSGEQTIAYPPEMFNLAEQRTVERSLSTWRTASNLDYYSAMTPDAHLRDFRMSRVDFAALGWPSTPGMTWRGINDDGVTHSQAEIYYNTEWTYTLTGEFDRARQIADLRTVTVHELGHSLGLNDQSPAACAPITVEEQDSVMHAQYIQKWIIRYDDRIGATGLYPAPIAPLVAPARPRSQAPANGSIDGYDLPTSPRQAVAFGGNDVGFEATVVSVGAPRTVTPRAAGGRLTYNYRPVRVAVTAVHRGSTVKVGQEVTLRDLGGANQAGRTVYADASPQGTWRAGARVVVLGRDPIDIGDGVAAITPNTVLPVHGAEVHGPQGRNDTITLSDLRAGLRR